MLLIEDQLLPDFIAALIGEGVDAEEIERAVLRVTEKRPGESLSDRTPALRAFAFGQTRRLQPSIPPDPDG